MSITLRRARPADAETIHALISAHVGENRLLSRSLQSIEKTIDTWIVAEDELNLNLLGCGTLASFSDDLAEVRSLAVDATYQRNGLGGKIVRELLGMAGKRGIKTVFTLTTAVRFFERQGFAIASRRNFPLKIYRDCLRCPVKFRCDEVTMVYRPEKHGA